MTTPAQNAQEPARKKPTSYPVKITVTAWDAQGKKFLTPRAVDARKVEAPGAVFFYVPSKQAVGTGRPVVKSTIADADGIVYVVVEFGGATTRPEVAARVEKKT